MNNNMLFIGWDRPITGRERNAVEHFQEFITYLGKLQQSNTITSFTPVMVQPHAGHVNGFIIINGEPDRLNKLTSDETFLDHTARGTAQMVSFSVLPAYTGKEMEKRMQRFAKFV